jgi:hypothetical protein
MGLPLKSDVWETVAAWIWTAYFLATGVALLWWMV